MVRNAYRLDQMAVSERAEPGGVAAGREERGSPIASRRASCTSWASGCSTKGDYTAAGPHLARIVGEVEREAECVQGIGPDAVGHPSADRPAGRVVRYFEIIKEKWPELELPFEKIVKVAAAYHELGEYERSYLVFRATTESSFGRESAVGRLSGRARRILAQRGRDEPAAGRISAGALYRRGHVRLVATGVCQGAASGGGSEAAREEDQPRRS